ncbi:hypothetical protein GQ44DRAFT_725620 [Phaeosphaeriaceae sp. PMI808]|nr:hypothetical protein GQ44DRAFT_725620 [Phaeosphaeriaceae sp. PMI808]
MAHAYNCTWQPHDGHVTALLFQASPLPEAAAIHTSASQEYFTVKRGLVCFGFVRPSPLDLAKRKRRPVGFLTEASYRKSESLVPVQPQAEQGCSLMRMAYPCVWYPITCSRQRRLSNLLPAQCKFTPCGQRISLSFNSSSTGGERLAVQGSKTSRVGQQLRHVTAHLHLTGGARAYPNIATSPHILIISVALTLDLTSSRVL